MCLRAVRRQRWGDQSRQSRAARPKRSTRRRTTSAGERVRGMVRPMRNTLLTAAATSLCRLFQRRGTPAPSPSASATPPPSASAPGAAVGERTAPRSVRAPEPPHDCPTGSAGPGSFTKPCDAKGSSRMMDGEVEEDGRQRAILRHHQQVAAGRSCYGKIAVYFYDKAGKQLDVRTTARRPSPARTTRARASSSAGVMHPGGEGRPHVLVCAEVGRSRRDGDGRGRDADGRLRGRDREEDRLLLAQQRPHAGRPPQRGGQVTRPRRGRLLSLAEPCHPCRRAPTFALKAKGHGRGALDVIGSSPSSRRR